MEINVKGLKERIEKNDVFILDVREPWEYEADHIHNSVNLPISSFDADNIEKAVPKDKMVVTVCEHGIRAEKARRFLKGLGYEVATLSGGMEAWRSQ